MERQVTVIENHGVNEVVTISEERAKELINGIYEDNRQGVSLFLDKCSKLAELRATKGYLHLGYDSFYNTKDAKEPLLKVLFGEDAKDSDTEAKNMCLLMTTFGQKQYDDNGKSLDRWELSDRTKSIMSNMSKGVLYELPALKECNDSNQDLESLLFDVFGLGFDEDGKPLDKLPTVRAIREVKALERQFKLPYKEALEAEAEAKAEAEAEATDSEATEATDSEATEPTEATESTEATDSEAEATDSEAEATDSEAEAYYNKLGKDVHKAVAESTVVDLKTARTLLKRGYIVVCIDKDGNINAMDISK